MTVEYTPRIAGLVMIICQVILIIGAGWLFTRMRDGRDTMREDRLVHIFHWVGITLRFLLGMAIITGSFVFVGIFYGFINEFTLPSTAIFSLFPVADILARHEPEFAYIVLLFGAVGMVVSWIASFNTRLSAIFWVHEEAVTRQWSKWGWLFITSVFIFSASTTWHGVHHLADLSGSAIAGLVPFSDANGHLESTFKQLIDGSWGQFAERRPYAAAMRSVGMLFTDFSPTAFLQLQILCIGLATCWASCALTSWRGAWSGVTFFGLIYILVRPYQVTFLTEPLGLFWTIIAVPPLISGLRTGALIPRVAGFMATCVSLLIRMGSMFTPLALALWIGWSERHDRKSLLRVVAAVSLGGVLLLAVNSSLARLYGSNAGTTGGNFAYTLCGLTHGGIWSTCIPLYAEQLRHASTEAEQEKVLYEKAVAKFIDDPQILFWRLLKGEFGFVIRLPVKILTGYMHSSMPGFFPPLAWFVLVVVGLKSTLWQRREKQELSFWILVHSSIFLSAPWVIFDDGWRVLSASFVLIAVFLSMGFASPLMASPIAYRAEPRRDWLSLGGLVVALISMLLAPAVAPRLDPLQSGNYSKIPVSRGETLILGGNHLIGFIVVPDGSPLPEKIPSMHFDAFKVLIHDSHIEQYEQMIFPDMPTKRFGVVWGEGLTDWWLPWEQQARHYPYGRIFIAPPDLLERRYVSAWKLRIDDVGSHTGYWYYASDAVPLNITGKREASIP